VKLLSSTAITKSRRPSCQRQCSPQDCVSVRWGPPRRTASLPRGASSSRPRHRREAVPPRKAEALRPEARAGDGALVGAWDHPSGYGRALKSQLCDQLLLKGLR
jgi:hypothetical protein